MQVDVYNGRKTSGWLVGNFLARSIVTCLLAVVGSPAGQRPVSRPERWQAVDQAAGDHIRRTAGTTKPRSAACSEDGERQPMSSVPCHQGEVY